MDKKTGQPCDNPGNAAYSNDHMFSSPTTDGHEDKVMKWEPAESSCGLPYDKINFRKQLANKTLLFIGNSLSRGTFWQLSSLIDHDGEVVEVDRLMQKKACSKTSHNEISCHLKPEGVPNMFFAWIQMLDNLADRVKGLDHHLPNAPDIVVFNLGLQHLLFEKSSWFNKQQKYFPQVVKNMREAWPNARLVYLPVSPANENTDRVRSHWQLQNMNIFRWNREVMELVEEAKMDWIPIVEPVTRGWSQELGHATYGYNDHFHPCAHVYSLWARMLMSILMHPPRA